MKIEQETANERLMEASRMFLAIVAEQTFEYAEKHNQKNILFLTINYQSILNQACAQLLLEGNKVFAETIEKFYNDKIYKDKD